MMGTSIGDASTFTLRILILLASITALVLTGLLTKEGRTYGLSYVALAIALITNFPLIFILWRKPGLLPAIPSVICSLANSLVAGILVTAGMVVLLSKKSKEGDDSANTLAKASGNLQFIIAGFYVVLAIVDCVVGCRQTEARREEYGSRFHV